MKSPVISLTTMVVTSLWASNAMANHGGWHFIDWFNHLMIILSKLFHQSHNSGGGGGSNAVPELDVVSAPLALALIAGIISIGLEIRRRQKK